MPPGADAVVMVEETKLVEATKEGEEVKVEILTKVIPRFLMIVITMTMCRKWRLARTSAPWAATSWRGKLSWAVGLSWDLERSLLLFQRNVLPFFFYQVGLLAAVGVTEVKVAAAPSVAVLSTGGLLSFYPEILTDN